MRVISLTPLPRTAMLNDSDICQPELLYLLKQTAYARCMDFDSEIVILRMCLGDEGGGFAHAKADLQESARPPLKKIVEIQQAAGKWNAILGHQAVMRPTLSVERMCPCLRTKLQIEGCSAIIERSDQSTRGKPGRREDVSRLGLVVEKGAKLLCPCRWRLLPR